MFYLVRLVCFGSLGFGCLCLVFLVGLGCGCGAVWLCLFGLFGLLCLLLPGYGIVCLAVDRFGV